jgi:hypothetical protein
MEDGWVGLRVENERVREQKGSGRRSRKGKKGNGSP